MYNIDAEKSNARVIIIKTAPLSCLISGNAILSEIIVTNIKFIINKGAMKEIDRRINLRTSRVIRSSFEKWRMKVNPGAINNIVFNTAALNDSSFILSISDKKFIVVFERRCCRPY